VAHFCHTSLLYVETIDFGDLQTAMTVLTTGTDPNIKDKKGKATLAHAQEFSQTIASLQQAGAKIENDQSMGNRPCTLVLSCNGDVRAPNKVVASSGSLLRKR
jgi:hypothetical protein